MNDVRDFLTLVAAGLTVGGMLFGITWKFIVQPHLQLHILGPLGRVEREIRRELRTNGGSSLRDRVEATNRTAQQALDYGKSNRVLLEGIGERLDMLERRRSGE